MWDFKRFNEDVAALVCMSDRLREQSEIAKALGLQASGQLNAIRVANKYAVGRARQVVERLEALKKSR